MGGRRVKFPQREFLQLLPVGADVLLLRGNACARVVNAYLENQRAVERQDYVVAVFADTSTRRFQLRLDRTRMLENWRWNELLPHFLQEQWSPEKKIVVYCSSQSCNLAGDVARRLHEEAKLPNEIRVLKGGWEEWLKTRK